MHPFEKNDEYLTWILAINNALETNNIKLSGACIPIIMIILKRGYFPNKAPVYISIENCGDYTSDVSSTTIKNITCRNNYNWLFDNTELVTLFVSLCNIPDEHQLMVSNRKAIYYVSNQCEIDEAINIVSNNQKFCEDVYDLVKNPDRLNFDLDTIIVDCWSCSGWQRYDKETRALCKHQHLTPYGQKLAGY